LCQELPTHGCYIRLMTTEQRVRRQPLLAVPSWLLFLCLFLPTLRVCGDPMIPLQFPPSYAVYLGGVAVAVIAGARLLRTRQYVFCVLVTLWTLTVLTCLTAWASAEVLIAGVIVGSVFLVVQILLVRALLRTAWSERGIAIGCLVHALLAVGWSALLVSDPDRMWGAYVSFGTGIAMMVASGVMVGRAHEQIVRTRRETEPAPLPEARALVRG